MSNIHHAEMTHVIRREKELEEQLTQLRKDYQTWTERVELAQKTGRDELAGRARERVQSIRDEASDLRHELKLIVAKKRLIRMDSRRPTGNEVRRAEALLESFRQSGLVDPEEAQMEAEFDELRQSGHGEPGPNTVAPQTTSPNPSTPGTSPSEQGATSPGIDDLSLEDLENLDAEELERLLDAEDF